MKFLVYFSIGFFASFGFECLIHWPWVFGVTETTGPRKLYSIVLLEWEVARLSKESAVAIQV
jgi:hypothetical protein